jgi:hypothetical protein
VYERYLEIAASKATSEAERDTLRGVVAVAAKLDEQERNFESRINASKAARGEGPTRMSKAKRQEVDQYAADAEELADERLREFAALDRARDIALALRAGLRMDVQFWSKAPLKAHPADRALIEEFAAAKKALLDALSAYLQKFTGSAS